MEYKDLNLTGRGILTIVTIMLVLGSVFASISSYLVDLIIL